MHLFVVQLQGMPWWEKEKLAAGLKSQADWTWEELRAELLKHVTPGDLQEIGVDPATMLLIVGVEESADRAMIQEVFNKWYTADAR